MQSATAERVWSLIMRVALVIALLVVAGLILSFYV